MKVEEKRKIKRAIELLMSDEGFNDGIDILCGLTGLERAVSKAMVSPSAKTVSVFSILANSEAVEQSFAPDPETGGAKSDDESTPAVSGR